MNEDRRTILERDTERMHSLESIRAVILDRDVRPLPSAAVSLKQCFSREQLDEKHIDLLILKKIALSMARLMLELKKRAILPGLYDMKEIFVDMDSGEYPLYLIHPERFQIGDLEQDYEWYPEDERLLPDRVFFDQEDQDRANQRFLFRILVGSSRGNIHLPPVRSEMDYAELFYNILPDEWKAWNESGKVVPCEEWIRHLTESIDAEETFARKIRERDRALRAGGGFGSGEAEPSPEIGSPGGQEEMPGGVLHILFIVLRTDLECADSMSRLLYNAQEKLEAEAYLRKYRLSTAIVYGDGAVKVRGFREYPLKFRFQIPSRIEEYSAGEAMVISAGLMEEVSGSTEEGTRIILLVDGRISNDVMFRAGVEALRRVTEGGASVFVQSAGDVDCEAFENLKSLTGQGGDAS